MIKELLSPEIFERARAKAANDEDLLDLLNWIEVLSSTGVSPTAATTTWGVRANRQPAVRLRPGRYTMNGACHILGCDVGITGCLALLNANTLAVSFHPLPTTMYMRTSTKLVDGQKVKKQRRCRELDDAATLNLIRGLAGPHIAFTVIEHQQVFPGQGAVSSAKLLYCYAVVKTSCLSANLLLETCKPNKWKKDLKLIIPKPKSKKGDKPKTVEKESSYSKKSGPGGIA